MSHTILVTCPGCRVQGPVPVEVQGSAIACRRCGTQFPVSASAPAPPAPVEEFALANVAPPGPVTPITVEPGAGASGSTAGVPAARSRDRETLISQYFVICAAVSTVAGVLALLAGMHLPVSPRRIFHFSFSLGVGIFSAGCTFAPERVLSHPRIAAAIGTSNPTVARVVCAVAMVLMVGFCWAVVTAPGQD